MYSNKEKIELLNDLKEMESFKVDLGDEGKILQEDIINSNGDNADLRNRLELYLYEYKLFCREPTLFKEDGFVVYLNSVELDFKKLDLILKDFNKYKLNISSQNYESYSVLNLDFTLKE